MADDELRSARSPEKRSRRTSPPGADTFVSVDPVAMARRVPGASRSHIASNSKIAVTGIGFTTMLGLVAVMGFVKRSSESETPLVPPSPTIPTQVVAVHPVDVQASVATTVSNTETTLVEAASVPASTTSVPVTSSPVVTTTQPTVTQAPVTQAPSGHTNGSR